MFNKLKQKIADGVEGVSPGRQTPLSKTSITSREEAQVRRYKKKSPDKEYINSITHSNTYNHSENLHNDLPHKSSPQEVLARVHHLLEVGRQQAQNNGKIEDTNSNQITLVGSQSRGRNSIYRHTPDDSHSNPALSDPGNPDYESTPNQSFSLPNDTTPVHHRQRKLSTSSNMSERSDIEGDIETRADQMNNMELREMYKKQERTLRKYKTKFSELVSAYKALQKDKEKLESTLTVGQDKQLRRIKELKETIELEQEGKRHLEETLRLNLEEKDDLITVLQTQVQLLKTKYGVTSPSSDIDVSSSVAVVDGEVNDHGSTIQSLQKKIKMQIEEIEQLKATNDHSQEAILRCEQEKKTAIEEIMTNMHHSISEQDDLKAEMNMLKDELNKKDVIILQMREEQERSEEQIRKELSRQIREDVSASQEKEMKLIFEEKEAQIKNTFADKVHDLQRLMEENEKQKEAAIYEKDKEINKMQEIVSSLESEIEQWKEKETKLKEKVQKVNETKQEWEKKYKEAQAAIETEKQKIVELSKQHEKDLKSKLNEHNEQIGKVKRTSQTKVYDVQEQLRKKSQELNEINSRFKTEIEAKVKEAQQHMQSEHAKASRKLEVKVSDMKKMIKELRVKLDEKESLCQSLEINLQDAKTEADQARRESDASLSTRLQENDIKIQGMKEELEHSLKEKDMTLQKYKDEILNQSRKVEELNLKIDEQNNEIVVLRCREVEVSAKLKETTGQREILENDVKLKNELFAEIEHKLEEKQNELQVQTDLLKNNSSENEKKLVESYESKIRSLDDHHKKAESRLTNEISTLTEKIAILDQEKENLDSKMQEQIQVHKLEIEKLLDKSSSLEAKYIEKDKVNLEMENVIKTLKEEESTLQNELLNLKTKISKVEEESKTLTQQLHDKLNVIEDLSVHNDSLSKTISDSENENREKLSDKDQNIEKLKNELESLHRVNKNLENNIQNLEQSHKTFLSQLENEHQEKITKAENDHQELLQLKETELRYEMNQLLQDKDTSVNDITRKLEEIRKQELREIETNYECKIKSTIEKWQQKLQTLQQEFSEKFQKQSNKVSEKDKIIAQLSNENDLLKSTQHSLSSEFSNKNTEMKNKFEQMLAEKNKLFKEKDRVEKDKGKLKRDNENLQLTLTEVEQKYRNEINELQQAMNRLDEQKCHDFNDLTSKHYEDRKLLMEEIERLSRDVKELRILCDKKDQEIDGKQQHSESHIEKLQSEYNNQIEKLKEVHTFETSVTKENHRNEVNNIISKHETELDNLKRKYNNEMKQANEKHELEKKNLIAICENKIKEANEKHEAKVNELITKRENLEKKYKKIITDRDKKNARQLKDNQTNQEEIVAQLKAQFSGREIELANEINSLKQDKQNMESKLSDLIKNLAESKVHYEDEIEVYKSREKKAWEHLDNTKTEYQEKLQGREKLISDLENADIESKNRIEELELKIMSTESNTKSVDSKLNEILNQKKSLEKKIMETEHEYKEKLREVEANNENIKLDFEEQFRKLQDEHFEKCKQIETEKENEMLSKLSDTEENNKLKLLELKNKAENKILKMKKDFNEQKNRFEEKITTLQNEIENNGSRSQQDIASYELKVKDLEKLNEKKLEALRSDISKIKSQGEISLRESKQLHELEIEKLKNLHQEKLDEFKSAVEETSNELLAVQDKLVIKEEELCQLQEKLEYKTVEKMEALKTQKQDLYEEHAVELEKVTIEAKKQFALEAKKITAKVEEKDFEYNSKIKQMMKEFQVQLGLKENEIQQAVQDAIEVAQKDERRIICEYDEQIMDMQKELHLREREMIDLRRDTESQIEEIEKEKDTMEMQYKHEIENLKLDYHNRLDELVKRHEEELLNASQNNTTINEAEIKMNEHLNDVEKSYVSKISELEEQHRNELSALEKKYKTQMKKSKNEMRKLLMEKGVTLPTGDESIDPGSRGSSNPGSDIEMDQSEVSQLKDKLTSLTAELKSLRQRERVLAMQLDKPPPTTPNHNNRPATLVIDNSLSDSVSSSPKSPQPLEFEYLRNILYQYMVGNQRKQMAKVLTAIVHFSPSQVKQILAKEEEREKQSSAGYYFPFKR